MAQPEDDLPGAFESARTVHYAAIGQPEDPKEFVTGLKRRMTNGLDRLSAALADGSAGGVKVTTRKGEPWITVLLTGFTDEPASPTSSPRSPRTSIDRATLQRRLLLALFPLSTNMGIRAIVATGEHGETEAALRHVRRHFITVDNLRAAVTGLVNGTRRCRVHGLRLRLLGQPWSAP